MEEFRQGFVEEALQLAEKLETILIELETRDTSLDDIQDIFRIMHTLKGSSAMFAYKNTEYLAHALEDVFNLIRNNTLQLSPEIIKLVFSANDVFKDLLANNDNVGNEHVTNYNQIIDKIKSIASAVVSINSQKGTGTMNQAIPDKPEKTSERVYYILFKPDSDVLLRGITPISIFDELASLGQVTSIPCTDDVPLPEDYNASLFYLAWDIFIKTKARFDELEDCFLFYLEHEYKILELQPGDPTANKEFMASCLSLGKGNLTPNQLILKIQQLTGTPVEGTLENKPLTRNETITKNEERRNVFESIKVDSFKLDELINLVSDLVTLHSRLDIISDEIKHEGLDKSLRQLSKLSKRFRDNALELRLIPVKVLVLKMQRLIRDLSIELNKDVEFITEGTNTELDKNIISRLEGPLLHILRNCLDHGIETPAERIACNKPQKGVIRFIAFCSGSNVYIQIQDDGKGIDPEAIRQAAIEQGLINKNEQTGRQETINLLFAPGFSTAKSITNISGRGVGLDVVKKEITAMRGEIDIESEKNLGTSFTLKLPLTLSIIDTLMVLVNFTKILIPREHIVSTEIGKEAELTENIGFNGRVIPLIKLGDEFSEGQCQPSGQINVIIAQYDKYYALKVDKIIGEHQAVVKPLGHYNHNHGYFSGASILGDGSLAFILDINKVISNKRNRGNIGNFNIK
ncbi:MAG: chemotaxis protein CheA [Bacteroidales bacterium]|nr:chemotaxis protein CheA [Bacteroidales bacterium]